VTKPDVGSFLNGLDFGFLSAEGFKRPFVERILPVLQPVTSVDELLKERIQFVATKTIAGAPAGFGFRTADVGAQEIEVWERLWISVSAGSGFVILSIFSNIAPTFGARVSQVNHFGGTIAIPLLGTNYNRADNEFMALSPIVLAEGQSIQLASSTGVTFPVASIINGIGIGYRIKGPRFAPQNISPEVTVA